MTNETRTWFSPSCPVCGFEWDADHPHESNRKLWTIDVACDHEGGYRGNFTLWQSCLGERRWLYTSPDQNSQYAVLDGRGRSNDEAVAARYAAEQAGRVDEFRDAVRTKYNLRCSCGIDAKGVTKRSMHAALDKLEAARVATVSLRGLTGIVSS